MWRHALVAVVLVVVGASPAAADRGDADFARVFAKPARSIQAPLELTIDGVALGTIVVELPPGAEPIAPTALLATELESRVRDAAQPSVRAGLRGSRISLGALRALGFAVSFDSAKLVLQISIPAALARTTTHVVGAGAPPEAGDAIGPSDVSGYINLRGHAGARISTAATGTERDPFALSSDGVLDVERWVLEARIDAAEQPIGSRRGDVLLSHDDPDRAVRYFAGDFAVPAAGFEPSYPVLGIGAARNFTLQPYRSVQPVGVFEFVLERPARVTIVVAGAPVQTLSLPAGRHDLRDLPLGAGIAEVELVIRDETGERRLVFSTIHPAELLARGVVQFSLGLGFALVDDHGLRDYAFTRPLVSARHRWGAASRLTLGYAFDGALDAQVAGAGAVLATTRGNFSLDVGASTSSFTALGHAIGLRYDYLRGDAAALRLTLSIAAHHVSATFHDLAPALAITRTHDELTVGGTRRIGDVTVARAGLRYVSAGERDASFGITRPFGNVSLDAELSVRGGGAIPFEARGFVVLHWSLPQHRTTASASTRESTTDGFTNELVVHRAPAHAVGGVATTIDLREGAKEYAAAASAAYTGYTVAGTATSTVAFDRVHHEAIDTTAVDVGTALAFAGGRATWSRPIAGSFVIVEATGSLADQDIGVDPSRGGYAARTNGFGLAVVPNFEPYRVVTLRLDAPELPLGVSLGPSAYHVLPGYRSGTLIPVGSSGTVFLRGVIALDGTPLPFETGELARPGARPLELMTNRAGRFSVIDVVAGTYELVIGGATTTIVVPRGARGIIDLGTVAIHRHAEPGRLVE